MIKYKYRMSRSPLRAKGMRHSFLGEAVMKKLQMADSTKFVLVVVVFGAAILLSYLSSGQWLQPLYMGFGR